MKIGWRNGNNKNWKRKKIFTCISPTQNQQPVQKWKKPKNTRKMIPGLLSRNLSLWSCKVAKTWSASYFLDVTSSYESSSRVSIVRKNTNKPPLYLTWNWFESIVHPGLQAWPWIQTMSWPSTWSQPSRRRISIFFCGLSRFEMQTFHPLPLFFQLQFSETVFCCCCYCCLGETNFTIKDIIIGK